MIWALVTGCDDAYRALLETTRPTLMAYAERHGFEYLEEQHLDKYAQGLPTSWGKIPVLTDTLESGDCEGVLWIDCDAVIVDGRQDIREEIGPNASMAWVCQEIDGWTIPNMGVVAFRGHGAGGLHWLDQIWEQRHLFGRHEWWEQGAAMALLGWHADIREPRFLAPNWMTRACQRLHTRWNVLHGRTVCNETAILHVSGYRSAAERLPIMQRAVEDARATWCAPVV